MRILLSVRQLSQDPSFYQFTAQVAQFTKMFLVVLAHHQQQFFQCDRADVLERANSLQLIGRQVAYRTHVPLARLRKLVEGEFQTLIVVVALSSKLVSVYVRQEGMLLTKQLRDSYRVTLPLDVPEVAESNESM